MLRGTLMGAASLPFFSVTEAAQAWREQSEAIPSDLLKEQPLVKLNSNENPYGPSEKARQAIIDAIPTGNRYPRPAISKLEKQIAEYENISPDQVVITAGSTELLGVFGLMAGMYKGTVIGCDPTFDFMLYYASKMSAEWIKVPLTDEYKYDLDGIASSLTNGCNLVFICNPNNPTGSEVNADELRAACQAYSEKCMVYVDEAYIEFSEHGLESSLVPMTRANKNIVVGRTFSKIYGLAGLRVGYAIGHPETIKKVRGMLQGRSITPSATSIAAAAASLGDEQFLAHCRSMNEEAKGIAYAAMEDWGVEYIPSSTSFVLFRTDKFGGTDVRKELQRQNILIRDYSHVPGWARVSIGTPDEMKAFVKATKKMVV